METKWEMKSNKHVKKKFHFPSKMTSEFFQEFLESFPLVNKYFMAKNFKNIKIIILFYLKLLFFKTLFT